ncbi:MAG: deoxyribose-phosphate aldolase [Anaerolineae bacterium]|nr:deoxyribose-phosphate aldolase [Anaerolineae bacterium]
MPHLELPTTARMIDHTLLRPDITDADWQLHCRQAVEYGFKTVAINNAGIVKCKHYLQNSPVLIDAAVSFPLGQCTLETKLMETLDAIDKGAGEVDYVINLAEVKNGNWRYVETEMHGIVQICRDSHVVSKVILETCYLADAEKKKICEIALRVLPDFVKTSTGFGTGGATVADVRLMKSVVGDQVKIKASGGIRSLSAFTAMVEAGAERIGTSSGIKILEELKHLHASGGAA